MKKNIIVTMLVLVLGVMTFGQTTVEPKNELHGNLEIELELQNGKVTPQSKLYVTYGGKTEWSGYCWAQNSEDYNQFYCGVIRKFTDWLSVSAGIGLQTGSQRLQYSFSVWTGKAVGNTFISNLFIYERGGNWMRNAFSVQYNKFTASLVYQRYKGVGPRLDVQLAKHFGVYTEYRVQQKSLAFGIKINF